MFFKKWANPGLFSVYFWSFQTNIVTIFTTSKMWKMSIQYPVLGFELTTFWLRVSSLNHQTRLPPETEQCYFPFKVSEWHLFTFIIRCTNRDTIIDGPTRSNDIIYCTSFEPLSSGYAGRLMIKRSRLQVPPGRLFDTVIFFWNAMLEKDKTKPKSGWWWSKFLKFLLGMPQSN